MALIPIHQKVTVVAVITNHRQTFYWFAFQVHDDRRVIVSPANVVQRTVPSRCTQNRGIIIVDAKRHCITWNMYRKDGMVLQYIEGCVWLSRSL